MEQLIITENQAEHAAKCILDKILPNLSEKLTNEFYNGVEGFLFEHYQNHKSKVHSELIKELSDEYVKDPNDYKFASVRKRIFEENKEEIFAAMQQWITQSNLEANIIGQLGEGNYFNWKWKDGIADFILNNWDMFKDDERVNSRHLQIIQNLKNEVAGLKSLIHELKRY